MIYLATLALLVVLAVLGYTLRKLSQTKEALGAIMDAESVTTRHDVPAGPVPTIDVTRSPMRTLKDPTTLGLEAGRALGWWFGNLRDAAAGDTSPVSFLFESPERAAETAEMFHAWSRAARLLPADAPELTKASHRMLRDLDGAYDSPAALFEESQRQAKRVLGRIAAGKAVSYSDELKLAALAAPLVANAEAPATVRTALEALASWGTCYVLTNDDGAPVLTGEAPAPAKKVSQMTKAEKEALRKRQNAAFHVANP